MDLVTPPTGKYYQFKRKERVFTLEDQDYIRQVFLSYGVKEEPTFDSWQAGYRWVKR